MFKKITFCSTILFLFVFNSFLFPQTEENPITKPMIENAEKIIGLEFTDTERDSMLGDLKDQLQKYQNMRNVHLDNSVMPSVIFNPIPVGFKFETEQKPV